MRRDPDVKIPDKTQRGEEIKIKRLNRKDGRQNNNLMKKS